MAKGDFYFPLYYQRLLTSTIGWTDEEFGAYLRLLIYQFDNGSIPDDVKLIRKISKKAAKNWEFFSQKFSPAGYGRLINNVMDEIRQDIDKKKETNKLNGKKGGLKRSGRLPNAKQSLSERGSETQAILRDNSKEIKERECPPVFLPIEECLNTALRDERWVRANKATDADLKEFNNVLERRGIYEKNPWDYKDHYGNWKASGKKDEAIPKNKKFQEHNSAPPLKQHNELH